MRSFILSLLAICPAAAQTQRAGNYEITLRPPADGLYAGEEMQLEFRLTDLTKPDPLTGFTPVIRAEVRAAIRMPSMPGMPAIEETAHPEGVPGDYGLHPTFAHGGEYRLELTIGPPGATETLNAAFSLDVKDPDPARAKKASTFRPFRLEVVTQPKRIRAGEPVELRLRIFPIPNPANTKAAVLDPKRPLTEFDLNHEKKLHLILTRAESFLPFFHLHPALQPDGTFTATHTFPISGEYSLFADTAPKGAGAQVLHTKLAVNGLAMESPAPPQTVSLQLGVESLTARKTQTLEVTVKDPTTGKPFSDLEPYLGAMGHLILVGDDGVTFVHAHPDERRADAGRNGVIPFLVRPPKPGRYNGMVEVQRSGQVLRQNFEVTAR